MINIVPIYLIHIPFPYSYECDECGAKHWYWEKRGFIKIGEKKLRVRIPPLTVFYDKKFLEKAEPLLIHKQLTKGNTTIKFKRYGGLDINNEKLEETR